MNERIRELAEQAELPVIDGMWDYNSREILCRENGEWRAATPTEIISVLLACEKGREKFAELIIGECADIAAKNQAEDMIWNIAEIIKEHFGVK